jgi:hypothetical protein
MGLFNATAKYFDDFIGHCDFPLTAAGVGSAWTQAEVKTSGTTTLLGRTGVAGGVVSGAVSATSEALAVELYHGDICSFRADDVQTVAFRLKTLAAITTAEYLVFGLRSARNDNPDSTTYNVQFKLAASTAVVLETDDNTTDNDDKATAGVLSTTFKEALIDFRQGLSDIRFYLSDANGKLTRLAPATTFNAAQLTGQFLQPFVVVGKSTGTTTPGFDLDYCEILYKRT